ncbi:nuclear transport factor 2 family protein [Paenibacillus sp. R14(2021)]|uniref:nuclear transport factor 2 family protein n=1 Tax=Paenibacillus sp. R14(2021) TaxID=2859228 RepID=UPI001C614534|nr:nuclear transport factor 2 family protein [Paenibacillus sp. R14(2021)]
MIQLPESVHAYFNAANDEQPDIFIAAFDVNAQVVDDNRAYKGLEAIDNWSKSDVFGPHVRFEMTDTSEHDGTYVVIASIDGDFDKTNLPDPFLLKHTFKLEGGLIKQLHISLP